MKNETVNSKTPFARAEKWLASPQGVRCQENQGAHGEYLKNRLVLAFSAGWIARGDFEEGP